MGYKGLVIEGHLDEDYSDSNEHSPEIDKKSPKEVADTSNELVPLTSNKSFRFHEPVNGYAGLCGGCGHVPGSFTLFSLCHF